jgi:hypothetical protein
MSLFVSVSASASAQDEPDPFDTARFRVGPLAMTPAIALTNVGVDNNVFNEWDEPKSDYTATVKPGADLWFRARRLRISAKAAGGYVHYQRYVGQRSWELDTSGRFGVDLLRLQPYLTGSYLSTRERPGYEIDVRARRSTTSAGGGLEVRLSRKTRLDLSAKREDSRYDANLDVPYLREAYDRREDWLRGECRLKLTPLTTLVVKAESGHAHFLNSPVRDNRSQRVTPGLEFNPFALIQGSAYAGVRRLNMLTAGIRDYVGPVAAVNLSYTLLGRTRFSLLLDRDVQYSYQVDRPYYVQTGGTLTITQSVGGPFDVQARAGLENLDYCASSIADPSNPTAADAYREKARVAGSGIGYRFSRDTRLGFNVDYVRRKSPFDARAFNGIRAGASITYAF